MASQSEGRKVAEQVLKRVAGEMGLDYFSESQSMVQQLIERGNARDDLAGDFIPLLDFYRELSQELSRPKLKLEPDQCFELCEALIEAGINPVDVDYVSMRMHESPWHKEHWPFGISCVNANPTVQSKSGLTCG